MFNNPFDSFHNTVAEAKEEREQLDRLLTISTPRERLLVIGIALLLCILVAWLFLGSVGRSLALDGMLVEPPPDPSGNTASVQVFVWVERGVSPSIEPGMPAVIELTVAGGATDTRNGEVENVAMLPVSDTVATFASVAPVSPHLVEITLEQGIDFASLDGRECRIVIELGRQSPIALFEMRRS